MLGSGIIKSYNQYRLFGDLIKFSGSYYRVPKVGQYSTLLYSKYPVYLYTTLRTHRIRYSHISHWKRKYKILINIFAKEYPKKSSILPFCQSVLMFACGLCMFEFRLAEFSQNTISHVHNWVSGISLNPFWELIDYIYDLALWCVFFCSNIFKFCYIESNPSKRIYIYTRWHHYVVMVACVCVVMLLYNLQP